MKKNILSMAALLIASAAVFTACSSDDNITGEQPANPTGKYTMTVSASKGGDATTRALTLSGSTLNATWATSENVYVKKGSDWATGSLQPEADGATATLKGSLSGIEINANDELTLQFPKSGNISYAGQVGTLEDIAANFDYATATVTVASVSATGNIVPTTATTTFENQQAIVKFTLTDKATGSAINATKLVISVGATDYTITPTSPTNVIYAAIPGFTDQTVRLTATVGNNTYTYEKASQSFTNGQYYEITVKMTEKPDFLAGEFSVSSTKKVKFSKGNLRYASGTWSFFDNQYDYYTSYSADAWDKFCWSTSATTYGMNTATKSSTYSGNFVDWGATMGAGWFTLSSAEWTYLFNTRTVNGGTGSGKSYTLGQSVNGKLGVVIYPDNYTGEVYSGSDWATFESAGCVFLPAAGYRFGTSVGNAGTYGGYWSATPNGTTYANYVYFNKSGSLSPAEKYSRYYGCSIRLVRQV
ncbi:MAG: hypothetical protein II826_03740 [Prevotella sp.]|nr:hypothetical protein [Prevotella sp.]